MPTILIGSAELGGISTTRSAFESLLVAGYDVDAVLLFPSPRYGNVEYLHKFFAQEHGIPVFGLGGPNSSNAQASVYGPPPTKHADSAADKAAMMRFYQGLVYGSPESSAEHTPGGVYDVVRYLRSKHSQRMADLATMAQRTRDTCWWPFTQHELTKSNDQVNVIDSAYGDFFSMLDQRRSASSSVNAAVQSNSLLHPVFDGSASWWTQCLGHAPQRLVTAAAHAAGRYGHVLFPNGTHQPALLLAEQLTGKNQTTSQPSLTTNPGYGWADRVFFSDDGSTGVEVALKMALQSSILRYSTQHSSSPTAAAKAKPGQQAGYRAGKPKQEWEVLGLKGSYHGDTIGAMDACEPSVYSEAVHWYRGRGFWFDPPTVEMRAGGQVVVSLAVGDTDTAARMGRHLSEELSASARGGTMFEQRYTSMQEVYDVEARLRNHDPLVEFYRTSIRDQLQQLTVQQGRKFGALVLEPLVMGAGGMVFVDPLYQRVLIDVCRSSEDLFSLTDAPLTRPSCSSPPGSSSRPSPREWRGIPVIFDEVFAGLYRLGPCTPASVLGVTPDISVLAKILTGGMVPMSVTLASRSIFNVFNQTESKVDALLHGHSYTAHPIGCAVALETLKAIAELGASEAWMTCRTDWGVAKQDGVWSFWSRSAVERLAELPNVAHAVAMGCVLKVALKDTDGAGGYTSTASVELLRKLRFGESAVQGHPTTPTDETGGKLPYNIHARPLGNVVYLMSSLNTPTKVLRASEEVLYNAIRDEAGSVDG